MSSQNYFYDFRWNCTYCSLKLFWGSTDWPVFIWAIFSYQSSGKRRNVICLLFFSSGIWHIVRIFILHKLGWFKIGSQKVRIKSLCKHKVSRVWFTLFYLNKRNEKRLLSSKQRSELINFSSGINFRATTSIWWKRIF